MSSFLKGIRRAVGQNRLEFVFSQIKSSLYSFLSEDKMVLTEQQELIEKITILEARWDQINSGVTSKSEEETKKLQIINSLLQLINENTLDDNYPNYFNFIKTFKHGQSEDENWLDACTRNDIEGYTSYLKEYSEGKFSMHAKHLIEKLNNAFVNNPIQQGAVIYGKVRGYLMLEPHLQEEFNNIIEKSILGPYLSYSPNIKLIFITGGTFAVFFEKDPNEKSTFTSFKAFLFGILCQLEAKKNEFNIGIAIHWEDDPRIKVVGRYCYIYNVAADLVKHYMSFSDKDHFFISTQIKEKLSKIIFDSNEKYFANENNFISYLNSQKARFFNGENEIIDFLLKDIETIYYSLAIRESEKNLLSCNSFKYFDKLKKPFELYNFFASDNRIVIGKNYAPYHWTYLEKRDAQDVSPKQRFVRRLVDAEIVDIIGLTHEGTKRFLMHALQERNNKPWSSLRIVFPSLKIIHSILDERDVSERVNRWEGAKRDLMVFLNNIYNNDEKSIGIWELLEYDGVLPFIGNKLFRQGKKVIRIAPILPGESTKEVFYSEIIEGTSPFNQLSIAFDRICELSIPINEYIVYGEFKGAYFLFKGILKRTNLDLFLANVKGFSYCFPVVLVALYNSFFEKKYSVLQKRTELNSSGDRDKFSNISGRIIELDVLRSFSNFPLIRSYNEKIADVLTSTAHINLDQLTQNEELTHVFQEITALGKGSSLPEDTWTQAANREIMEELGLKVSMERLKYQDSVILDRKTFYLYFKIYSLEITNEEFNLVKRLRPDAELERFTINKLESLWESDKLNALLQSKFKEVFIPMFNRLQIWKG